MLVWTFTFQHRHFYVFYYRKLVMRDDLYKKKMPKHLLVTVFIDKYHNIFTSDKV